MNHSHTHLLAVIMVAATILSFFAAACERDERPDENTDTVTDTPVSRTPFDSNGASVALFSVADGLKVHFSKGNLQYTTVGSHTTPDGQAAGTFRFAERQYDYIGQNNDMVSDTNSAYIDLLCWGSSGWHVAPWSDVDGDYDIESLCGSEAFADWGVYNAISNGGNRTGMWRTLTRNEWDYLVNRRAASTVGGCDSARYAQATVCGVAGLILFPDTFACPTEITINGINSNNMTMNFADNCYTAEQWASLEDAGAIFLPAAGFRGGTWISTDGEGGSYWASTCNPNRQAYALLFINGLVNASAECTYDKDRGYGRSVRLVME